MKKNYIVPVLEIEEVEIAQNLLLTVSPGDPFTSDDTVSADSKAIYDFDEE